MSLLNVPLIRERRRELGFSQRALAKELGQSSAWVASLEKRANHRELRLGQLARLAETLGVSLSELLRTSGGECTAAAMDATKIEALLFDAQRAVPPEVLAETLDWTLQRTLRALGELRQSLATRGLSLQRTNGGFKLVGSSNALTKTEWSRVIKAHAARFGLKRNEAKALYGVFTGAIADGWESRASNDLRVCMARLIKNQLVVESDDGPALHPDVEYALKPALR